ncbi:MAG: LysE family translocator [bacterium]|jgi:threonine/homoserine/homoserine lactone efflux protein|nr:LysE family translocator [bacterium]
MEFLTLAFVYGLNAGFSPGPLMTVIISESVKHGKKEGLKVALAPLLTDLPIVLISLLLISRLQNQAMVLGLVALLGGIYLFYLGLGNFRYAGVEVNVEQVAPQSIRKGVITNFLSPNPYMFWLMIGAPTTTRAYQQHPLAAAGFLLIFYVLLMGSKFAIALIAASSRHVLKSRGYILVYQILGVLLCVFGIYFFYNALQIWGLIG